MILVLQRQFEVFNRQPMRNDRFDLHPPTRQPRQRHRQRTHQRKTPQNRQVTPEHFIRTDLHSSIVRGHTVVQNLTPRRRVLRQCRDHPRSTGRFGDHIKSVRFKVTQLRAQVHVRFDCKFRAELHRQIAPLQVGFNHGDFTQARDEQCLHQQESNRSGPEQQCFRGGLWLQSFDAPGHTTQWFGKGGHLEVHVTDFVDVRGGCDHVFGEASTSGDTECLIARAMVSHSALTVMAGAAGDNWIECDSITLEYVQYARADLIDDACDFVSWYEWEDWIEVTAVEV